MKKIRSKLKPIENERQNNKTKGKIVYERFKVGKRKEKDDFPQIYESYIKKLYSKVIGKENIDTFGINTFFT